MALKLKRRINAPATRISRPDYFGSSRPRIIFVVDPWVGAENADEPPEPKSPLPRPQLEFLTQMCRENGISLNGAAIVACCPPVTREVWDAQKRLSDHLKLHRAHFLETIRKAKPRMIVALGKSAASQVLGRSVKITQVRGAPIDHSETNCLVFPSLGLSHVIRVPENRKVYDADFATINKIIDADFGLDYQDAIKRDYKWVTDIQFLVDHPPEYLCVDTEYTGGDGDWYNPDSRILTVQLSTGAGTAYCLPIEYSHIDTDASPWYPGKRNDNVIKARLIRQLKQVLENPKVKVFGQAFKGDFMMLRAKLGITVANYDDDTINLAHAVDENMLKKDLDELVRVYVPPMSGYADEFNRDPIHEKKTRMDKVPPGKMLMYGCGDADATWRVRETLLDKLTDDKKALNCHRRVVIPALRALCDLEEHGFCIDRGALRAFEKELRAHQKSEYDRLYKMVPREIRAEFIDSQNKYDKKTGKLIKRGSLTRQAFMLQMLFLHPKGLRLKPRVFTKSTAKLKDPKARVPSCSTKQHLAYFVGDHPFIDGIMDYVKNEKLLGTYVGTEGDDDDIGGSVTGFYKYISRDGRIRPSYLLHRTSTGRSASIKPNGQNFPKRGKLAKKYREIFVAPPGHVLIEVDFSQIELRIAAIMAQEPTMMDLYRRGKDIHAATAAAVMGISLDDFYKLPKEERDHKRFQAKAVNFGFLYGMGWRKFITYAKTEYGIDFTDEEAQGIRQAFFRLYKNLKPWHQKVEEFVKEHGYVRTFDGRVRHLPSVWSPDEGIAHQAIRQAVNSPVQGFGSDLGLMAIALINANVSRNVLRPIGFIHDAIVCIAPEAKAKEACATIKYWMEHIPLKQWFGFTPPIPIIAEASVGKNLSKMIELENDWYKDDGIKSWFDIQTAQYEHDHAKWKKDCAEAKKAGKNLPDEPKKPVAQPRRKLTIQRTVTPPPKPARPRLVLKRRA